MIHKKVIHNGGKILAYGHALNLPIENSIKHEKGGGEENFDKVDSLRGCQHGNKFNGFGDRNFGK